MTSAVTPSGASLNFYVNPNSKASFEQSGNLVRTESPNKNVVDALGLKTIMSNAKPAEITAVDVTSDNASMRDRYQTLALQPIVPKVSDDKLVTQAIVDTQLLWKDIKVLADASDKLPWFSKINVGTAIGLGAGLSAGYLMMAFRFGALLTSSLVTFPVWQWVDPLPILETSAYKSNKPKHIGENEQDANASLEESIETLVS